MKRSLQSLSALAMLAACFVTLAGCREDGQTTPNPDIKDAMATFKSAQPAPDGFDAWDFVWKGPKRDLNVSLEAVVLQPDGKEYAKQNLAAYPGKSENIHLSFSPGFAGGDPKVFYRETIRCRFRVAKGGLVFLPADLPSFKFRFFKKDANGDVDWRKPFQTIDAVLESQSAAPAPPPRRDPTGQKRIDAALESQPTNPAPSH